MKTSFFCAIILKSLLENCLVCAMPQLVLFVTEVQIKTENKIERWFKKYNKSKKTHSKVGIQNKYLKLIALNQTQAILIVLGKFGSLGTF